MGKQGSISGDTGRLRNRILFIGGLDLVKEWIEQEHDRLSCVDKWDDTHQSLGVVKELLDDVWPSQHSQMVLNPADVGRFVCSFVIPHPSNVRPDFSISEICLFNSHPIPCQIPEALDPRFPEARDGFLEKCHH